jgi:FMN phosphatase YigB (HAD superfamily)
MSRAPRGIGFDFDHTLGLDHGLERTALLTLAAAHGHPVPDDPSAARWLDALLADFRSGRISMEAMIAAFAATLDLGALDPQRWRETCYALVDDHVTAIDHAVEVVRWLRARAIPVAILTNGWSPLQERKIARALGPDAIDIILVSDVIAASKPDGAAFDALARALGVPARDVWYVGDAPRADVGGALAFGMTAIWLDAEEIAYPSDVPPPTHRIGGLRELERLVENALAP